MSQKIGDISVISEEPDKQCEECGKIDECRPYGVNGKQICFDCAMKDPIGTQIRMAKQLFGDNITPEEAKEQLTRSGKMKAN